MKKFLIVLFVLFTGATRAETVNIDWLLANDTIYTTSTCELGGDLIIPATNPTKYGHTFQGWFVYSILEYIESTGTQYIDTGITINKDSKVDILYSMTSTSATQMPFGTRISASAGDAMNGIFRTHGSSRDTNRVAFGNGGGTNRGIQGYDSSNTDYNLVIDKNGAVINGTTVATFPTSSITNTFPMYIFACNTSGTEDFLASMKLYSFKLYNNNVLVRDFVPVKRLSDNAIGLLDDITGQFFENAGMGEFIAGPEL